ncbi:hypothetical protein ACM6PT_17550, partial [Klebsiella pneumoniae]
MQAIPMTLRGAEKLREELDYAAVGTGKQASAGLLLKDL